MKTMEHLSQEQLNYVCSKIPVAVAKDYFLKNPRDFQRLEKGFRAKSLSNEQVARILLRHYRDRFIQDFLIQCLYAELKFIEEKLRSDEGNQEVYIEALGDSIFDENVALYFQLIKQARTNEYIELMEAAIRREKRLKEEWLEEKNEAVEEKDDALTDLKEQVSKGKGREEKLKEEMKKQAAQIEAFEKERADAARAMGELESKVEGLVSAMAAAETRMDKTDASLLKNDEKQAGLSREWKKAKDALKADKRVDALDEKVATLAKQQEQIKRAVKELSEKQEAVLEAMKNRIAAEEEAEKSAAAAREPALPKRPGDMDLFGEFFEYNLKAMGLEENNPAYDAFLRYVESIAFEGRPLLVKSAPCMNLANALANTLDEKPAADAVSYDAGAPMDVFKSRLDKSASRVLCIHNVIGSGEELPILDLLQSYRDKIIFLTYDVDRTLYYLPEEAICQMHYVNLDGYTVLSQACAVTESPSRIDEVSHEPRARAAAPIKQGILREIGSQCGLSEGMIQKMNEPVEDGESLDAVLLFTMLPYVFKVLRLNPFAESKRLDHYAGAEGKSPLKKPMLEWYDR